MTHTTSTPYENDFGSHMAGTSLHADTPPPVLSRPFIIQSQLSDKIIKKFSGYMTEDPTKFVDEFESYLTLSNVDSADPKAIAAFHLHLQGPALVWLARKIP